MRSKSLCLISLAATLTLAGCAQYATVSETRPRFTPVRSTVKALLAANESIVKGQAQARKEPLSALACYLHCAGVAAQELQRNPNDEDALRTYNFAVARIFTTIQAAKLDPWAHPLHVPAADGDYVLTHEHDPRPQYNPALYDFTPADQFDVRGTYVTERTEKKGLGAPLVVVSKEQRKDAAETFTMERTYYCVTAYVQFQQGRRCVIHFGDPLNTETVKMGGRTFPLAADFTVPLAVVLAKENPKKLEAARVLNPEKFAKTARIVRLQPYDPHKTVVMVVHGLADSPATWAPMLNKLRGDPEIRQRYQFWYYSYPSGYPYPYSASLLREQLDAIEKRYPLRHKMVLVGHSMGSLISRVMITDSGDKLWMTTFGKPPSQVEMSAENREILEKALIFRHREEVGRVIFISGPHRGSDMSTGWIGRLGSRLIRAPKTLLTLGNEMRKAVVQDPTSLQVAGVPNSVDTLAPNNRFVRAINTIPITPGIPYHSIIGDRGKGGNKDKTPPVNSDGVVPYWSSHLDGAQSELIVPSNHSAHQNPQAIAEVHRILLLNAGISRSR